MVIFYFITFKILIFKGLFLFIYLRECVLKGMGWGADKREIPSTLSVSGATSQDPKIMT